MKKTKLIILVALVCVGGTTLYRTCTPKTAESFVKRGYAYEEKEKLDMAIADYTEAIRLDSNYSEAYLRRAFAYSRQGNKDNALNDYTSVIRLDPNNVFAYYFRAEIYGEKGELEKSIADYSKTTQLWSSHDIRDVTYRGRGDAYYKIGDFNSAIADYEAYLQIRPEDNDVKEKLIKAKNAEFQQAVAGYTEAIRLNPNNADAYFKRGYLYYMQIPDIFKTDPAQYVQQKRLKRVIDHLLGDSDWDQVISDWESSLKINPNHADAKRYLELALQQRGY